MPSSHRTADSKLIFSGFEPQTSWVWSDCSTNWAKTTTAQEGSGCFRHKINKSNVQSRRDVALVVSVIAFNSDDLRLNLAEVQAQLIFCKKWAEEGP